MLSTRVMAWVNERPTSLDVYGPNQQLVYLSRFLLHEHIGSVKRRPKSKEFNRPMFPTKDNKNKRNKE